MCQDMLQNEAIHVRNSLQESTHIDIIKNLVYEERHNREHSFWFVHKSIAVARDINIQALRLFWFMVLRKFQDQFQKRKVQSPKPWTCPSLVWAREKQKQTPGSTLPAWLSHLMQKDFPWFPKTLL